ncbi:hypothetical protein pb186bvf_018112 [Paramecium bursaria]
MEKKQYDIPAAEFTALGIWTRYYAFYLDINIQKQQYRYGNGSIGRDYAYSIITGTFNDGSQFDLLILVLSRYQPLEYFSVLLIYRFQYFSMVYHYEGVWMFTYIGIDKNNNQMNIFLVNTKTDLILNVQHQGQIKQIKSIKLFGEDNKTYPFSGQISFSQSQSEQLLTYLKSCDMENSCTLNTRYKYYRESWTNLLLHFNSRYGWFKFTPDTQMKNYNNLILQIVQYDWENLKYNGFIPLKISLNFDKTNLTNNGIIVETSSYQQAIWNDDNPEPIKVKIFDESYLELLQSWVYFRFLQYEQIDSSAEFYLSFSDSSYVNKNMGQLNLFKYGHFYIYLGQSQLKPFSFLGQLANFNIQSCLQSYPKAKNTCHSLCLTCIGPLENQCLTCVDQTQINRVFNQNTITCDCRAGLFPDYGKVQCMQFQAVMKSATFKQFQVEQSYIQPCKEGQFQYQIGELIKCYDCPQQSSQGILCADCLENILTWQKTMKCSYDYYQENNNNDNTYIKYQRPSNQIEFYYIHDELLQLCLGCILDEGSHQIVQGNLSLYGKCHQNYYYKDYSCHPCQQNCETCDDETGTCNSCKIGFGIKQTTLNEQICIPCPDYCLKCAQGICQECLDGFTPGEGICQKCGANCLICDYDTILNRPKCRVCKYSGYFLPFDGFDCIENTIENCKIQYQKKKQYFLYVNEVKSTEYDNLKTTLGFDDYSPVYDSQEITKEIITNHCALCESHYINDDTNCQYDQTIQLDEQVIIEYDYRNVCCIEQNCKKYDFEEGGIWCQRVIFDTKNIYLSQYQSSEFTS